MDADFVTFVENNAGRPEINFYRIDLARLHHDFLGGAFAIAHPVAPFADVVGAAIGIDIAKSGEKVGVRRVRRNPEFHFDPTCDFFRLSKDFSFKRENIGAALEILLVFWARRYGQLNAANCRSRSFRMVCVHKRLRCFLNGVGQF